MAVHYDEFGFARRRLVSCNQIFIDRGDIQNSVNNCSRMSEVAFFPNPRSRKPRAFSTQDKPKRNTG